MSLPNTTRDTTEHPSKNAVSAPVDKRKKAADVDRKLRFYAVIQAFRQGRYPSNQQIDAALKYTLAHSLVHQGELSSEGRKLIQDCRDIIETARLIVQEKNADELFQNFMWNTHHVDLSHARKDANDVLPVDKAKAQDDSRQAACHLRTLGNLIATNSEVRKLLSDFSIIGRDILARAAFHAADNIRPDQDAVTNIDRPAPVDQFETAGGRQVGPGETPVAELDVPGTNTAIRHHPQEGTEVEHEGQVHSASQAVNEAQDCVYEARDTTYAEANGIAGYVFLSDYCRNRSNVFQSEANDPDAEVDDKKSGLKGRFQNLKNGLSDRIAQEHKDIAHEKIEQGRKVLAEDYFPEDRREQFIYRGKKAILECQKHNDHQESIRWLLSMIEEYAGHGRHIASEAKEAGGKVADDDVLRTSTVQIRTLLERFANGKCMDIIFDAINNLIDDAKNDEEFRKWFQSVDTFSRKVLLEPGYVLESKCNSDGREIRDSGRCFYDEKYKAHFDRLFDSIGTWFSAMGEDPLNKRFGDDWARLTRDLLFDSEGSLKFKPDLWMDIRKVILPSIVDRVGHIPIPRIEYTDESLDLVVENLTLQGRNLFPNIVSFEVNNFMKFSPYNTINDVSHHEFTLMFGHIQADMRDVAFYFRKKTGIPKLTDSGLADVVLGGHGLSATVHLVSSDKDKSSVFKVKSVRVKVDSLRFSIRDSKHDILYKTLRPLATGLIKKQIQKAVADAITTGMEYVDGQLVAVRDRVDEARASPDSSHMDVLRAAFQRKKEDVEESPSAKTAERKSQFKVVAKRDSAILPEHGHPSGWATKAQERAEAAVAGEGWHSDAFTIA
ncbi:hypothetical protein B0F90DRAFT_1953317 [Multifurca ochricompacta]|uniref:Uncharacterized protein n=1 Tax=Multifurca ochricompacta TaxID=376703 RepID=A0AAD4M0F6_9AGAM|nr:hypothetical protein B0F90DRAFT_1953317 [Multifurca ochricompacta]